MEKNLLEALKQGIITDHDYNTIMAMIFYIQYHANVEKFTKEMIIDGVIVKVYGTSTYERVIKNRK